MATPTASDTTTATGSIQTLFDITGNKYFSFKIDTVNMVAGDTLVLTIYDRVLPASGYDVYKVEVYTGAQTEPVKFMAPYWTTEKIKVTIQQTTTGTGGYKSYAWILLESD